MTELLFDVPALIVPTPKWTLRQEKVEWDTPVGPRLVTPQIEALLPPSVACLARWLVVVDGHWLHSGPITRSGYCRVHPGDGRKFAWAHRYSYEVFVGAIEPGNVVDHECERKRCCFPGHLSQCTNEENVRRWHLRRKSERLASQLTLEELWLPSAA